MSPCSPWFPINISCHNIQVPLTAAGRHLVVEVSPAPHSPAWPSPSPASASSVTQALLHWAHQLLEGLWQLAAEQGGLHAARGACKGKRGPKEKKRKIANAKLGKILILKLFK